MGIAAKIWLITATSLLVVGAIIFTVVMTSVGWDFTKLSSVKYETNEYHVTEKYKNISINVDTTDINFIISELGETKIVCYEEEKAKHSVSVKDGTLTVGLDDKRGIFDHIGIDFSSPKISIYIPAGKYENISVKSDTGDIEVPKNLEFSVIDISVSTGDVKCAGISGESIKIKTSTGHITLSDVSTGLLDLAVSTGKVDLSGIECEGEVNLAVSTGKAYIDGLNCKSFTTVGGTGEVSMKNAIASEKFDIKRTTGDVKFDSCDAPDITVNTHTGSVIGTLLTNKVFVTKTSTGKIVLPDVREGGSCSITTSTGDIKISIGK